VFFQFSRPLFFVCFFLLFCFYSSNPFAFPFLFFLFFLSPLFFSSFFFMFFPLCLFVLSFFFQLPWYSNNVHLFFIPPFLSVFFFKIFLSLNTALQNLSLPKPLIVSLFSYGIYKQEEREPPCSVQSWLKVWHGVASVQPPKSHSQGMATLSFLHHSGRVMSGFGQVGRERGEAGEKTSSSPTMRPGKKKRSVVQNGTVLCLCLLLF